MNLPFEQVFRALANEAFAYRNAIVGFFVLVSLAIVAAGLYWPKTYTVSTKVLVDDSNIIQPLMQGAAVATDVTDRARLAREVIYGRKIMTHLYEYSNWLDDNPDVIKLELAAKAEAAKTEAAKTEAAKTEAAKTEAAKTDAAKTDAAKTDAAKTEAAKTEAAKTEASDESSLNESEDDKQRSLLAIEKELESIKKRTQITRENTSSMSSNQRGPQTRSIIRISYSDKSDVKAFKITERLTQLFIDESLEAKARESRAAYEFIEKQVHEYHEKLTRAEQELKEFRVENLDARPGSEGQIDLRINSLRERMEQANQELREAQIRFATLTSQLSGEAEATAAFTLEGQYRQRISELQNQLAALRLNYHETYPDVVRIKRQIDDLRAAIDDEKSRRENKKKEVEKSRKVYVDEGMLGNPLYQQLRTQLSETRTLIATLELRLDDTKRQLTDELDRAKRMHGGEVTLAELTRDYQVNRDIYQDLLRRRENARVSMNLDLEHQGLTLRIQEPATFPLEPSGPRFIHFVLAGLLLGAVLPFGILYMVQTLDPRIRFASILSDKLEMPVMAVVPRLLNPEEEQAMVANVGVLGMVILANIAAVIAMGTLKLAGVV